MWHYTTNMVPDEHKIVEVCLSDGETKQTLKRIGNLWFVEDGSMYVYFVPLKWRYL